MKTDHLYLIGINHETAPLDVREKYAYSEMSIQDHLHHFRPEEGSVVIINTCNRTEWIFHASKKPESVEKLLNELAEISSDYDTPVFYYNEGLEAYQHMCRVVSGMNSLVPGETQITGQWKKSFERSFEHKFADNSLQEIYQQVLRVSKRLRTETGLGSGRVSVSSAAIQVVADIFETFIDKNVLLVGAGEMCELAAEHFVDSGVQSISVVNRSLENAQKLADKFSAKAYQLDDLKIELIKADIVLSSTGSPTPIIDKKMLSSIMVKRKFRPIILIDIAVPRDINEDVSNISDVYLYNLDHLEKLAEQNMDSRKEKLKYSEELLQRYTKDSASQGSSEIGTVIGSLQKRTRELQDQELEKLFRKFPDFSEQHKDAIRASLHSVSNRMLHDPILSLRKGNKKDNKQRDSQNSFVDLFKDFFNL
ncbi:MAG: glutamyl-tRNA reductase [Lentisphaeria bacterium]|nr:glutamyl-tRNA reductase [Lentisphaeria bacterium]